LHRSDIWADAGAFLLVIQWAKQSKKCERSAAQVRDVIGGHCLMLLRFDRAVSIAQK
jgi:hypothetical protein